MEHYCLELTCLQVIDADESYCTNHKKEMESNDEFEISSLDSVMSGFNDDGRMSINMDCKCENEHQHYIQYRSYISVTCFKSVKRVTNASYRFE